MNYSEKIKELDTRSKLLLIEYRIIAREINTYLRTKIPVEQDMLRLQNRKQEEFRQVMQKHHQLMAKVAKGNVKFFDPYIEEEED